MGQGSQQVAALPLVKGYGILQKSKSGMFTAQIYCDFLNLLLFGFVE